MAAKTKLILKWAFVFSVLMIWTYLVLTASAAGFFDNTKNTAYYIINSENQKILPVEMQNAITKKNFNIPIYEETTAGIEKATSDELLDMLFNHNFEVQEKSEYASDESCSLRAEGGSLSIDEMDITTLDLSFYIPLKNDGPGQGSLTAQKDRDRFSLDFEVTEILETNSEALKFRAGGKGKLNKEEFSSDNIIITFDKINNKVGMSSTDYPGFEIKDMQVSFTKGCFGEEKKFNLIIDNGKLTEKRSIEDVRQLLEEHPEMTDMYEGLKRLNRDYWWLILPDNGGFISG